MKPILTILLFLSLTACSQDKLYFSGPTIAQTGPDHVIGFDTLYYYILAGQSNMAGRAHQSNYSAPYSGKIKTATHAVFMKNYFINPGVTDTLETGVNSSDQNTSAGVQPNLGFDLCDYKNRNIYFLQAARGGQPITEWNSSQPLGAWLDSSILLAQSRSIASGKRFAFKALVWLQGETGGGADTAAYHTALSALIARVRTLTGNATLPTYIVQMKDCQSGVSGLTALQAVQEDIAAEPNNNLVGKDDTPPNTCADTLHFDYATYVAIANFIFNLIKDL